jgi:hypothetical protein
MNERRWIVRPHRIFLIQPIVLLVAKRIGVITVKGYCKEHDVEFELPPRTEAPFHVKCPVGGEKILRIKAILAYIKHKRGESK